MSPFLRGGWWTRGVSREKALGFGEEDGEGVESKKEDEDGSSWFLQRKVSGLEAVQPMNDPAQMWKKLIGSPLLCFLSLSLSPSLSLERVEFSLSFSLFSSALSLYTQS